jgi:hypothetical protein
VKIKDVLRSPKEIAKSLEDYLHSVKLDGILEVAVQEHQILLSTLLEDGKVEIIIKRNITA